MHCPTCGGTMTYKRSFVTHGTDGTAYDAELYECSNDDNYLTWEKPQVAAEESGE